MYCNAACKKKHRHKHREDCERRVAESNDEKLLFKQPPPEEDCPICMMRLPPELGQTYMACCGQMICSGCIHAVQSRSKGHPLCPYYRVPQPITDKEAIEWLNKRVELNDTNAIHYMGVYYSEGLNGLRQNYNKALTLFLRAAELGNSLSYNSIGNIYRFGRGVEVDLEKGRHYWELAAIGGAIKARYNLGVYEEWESGNMDRALKHYMIAVRDGCNNSLKCIQRLHRNGHATRDDCIKALRSHQAYIDEIMSDQRDEAAAKIRMNLF